MKPGRVLYPWSQTWLAGFVHGGECHEQIELIPLHVVRPLKRRIFAVLLIQAGVVRFSKGRQHLCQCGPLERRLKVVTKPKDAVVNESGEMQSRSFSCTTLQASFVALFNLGLPLVQGSRARHWWHRPIGAPNAQSCCAACCCPAGQRTPDSSGADSSSYVACAARESCVLRNHDHRGRFHVFLPTQPRGDTARRATTAGRVPTSRPVEHRILFGSTRSVRRRDAILVTWPRVHTQVCFGGHAEGSQIHASLALGVHFLQTARRSGARDMSASEAVTTTQRPLRFHRGCLRPLI